MELRYLSFDYSEDTEGTGSFEAMASIWAEQVPAVQAEIVSVLDWAHQAFPDTRAPVAEGGDWDYDLHGLREFSATDQLSYDAATRQLSVQSGPAGKPRHTFTLLLSASPAFSEQFRQRFDLDAC
ncbi:hypothetical protein SAMN05216344_103223 [Polaromonas sp. OV174]|nr:hypothetical protein [Polaromonas sp. OV174]SFB80629.1 hypothetical protein SAMN05216344_103223 [Polaromonas sp. OV174]